HAAQGRSAAGAGRTVRRDQGAAPRLLSDRLRRSRRGAGLRARTRRSQSGRRLRNPSAALVQSGQPRLVSDLAFIDAALISARPRAVAALLRYFRNLDTAEEAYQDACLRALKTWPEKGPPRDPAAWLIMVVRNAGLDGARRQRRLE